MAIRDIIARPTTKVTLQVIKNAELKEFKATPIKNAYFRETGNHDTYRLVGRFVGEGEFTFTDQQGVVETYQANGKTGVIHVSKQYLDELNKMRANAVELTADWNYSIQLETETIDKDSVLYGSYRVSLPEGKNELDDIDAVGAAGKIDDVGRYREADQMNGARNDEYMASRGKEVTTKAAEGKKKAKLL